MSGAPSVVNEKIPLMPDSIRTSGPRSAGTIARAAAHDSANVSGVKSRTEGITGACVGCRIVAASIGIGTCAYDPTPSRSTCSRKYRSRSWARTIGWTFSRSGGIANAAISARGVVLVY